MGLEERGEKNGEIRDEVLVLLGRVLERLSDVHVRRKDFDEIGHHGHENVLEGGVVPVFSSIKTGDF